MINEQFNDLFSRLENEARLNPFAYRFKVFLLSSLGNAYVGVIVLILLGLLAALFASIIQFKWIVAKPIGIVWVFLCLVLRPLWVRLEPPEGIEITAGQAPELLSTINELRSTLGAPRVDHVLITDELNASILQLPSLGIFGWHRNYLMIGLPLMKCLTREQFKAVLAHEFSHLAKGHGIESHSIYRQRLRWSRLVAVLEETESKGRFLFMPFLNWFVPCFAAFSFPLARANEYEADAISVRLTSSRAAAEALTNIEVVGGYLSDFYWPLIEAEFGRESQPGREPYFEMSDALASRLDKVTSSLWLGPAMANLSTPADTHPALSERLAAMGEGPSFSPPEPGEGADGLLGPTLEQTTKALDSKWRDSILSAWELRHKEIQEGRRRLTVLNEKHANGFDLTLQERWERAELTEAVAKDADAALEQWRALHDSVPGDPFIWFALGSRLIMRNDNTGCALVERAIQFDEDAIVRGCELLRDYYGRNGDNEEFYAWDQRLIEQSELQATEKRERSRVAIEDTLEPHGLPTDTLDALVAQLRAIPDLRSVYLVRKRVVHAQHRPLYVLGFNITGPFLLGGTKRATDVLQEIQKSVQLPRETLIINVDSEHYRLGRKFRRLRWAKILDPASSRVTKILMTIIKKVFGVLAVLFGILTFLLVLNDIFHFLYPLQTDDDLGIGTSVVGFALSIIMVTVGTRWLIDPIDLTPSRSVSPAGYYNIKNNDVASNRIVRVINAIRKHFRKSRSTHETGPLPECSESDADEWSGRIWVFALTVLCLGIIAFGYFYPELRTGTVGYHIGHVVGTGLIIWTIFNVTLGRNHGYIKAVLSLVLISAAFYLSALIGMWQEDAATIRMNAAFRQLATEALTNSQASPRHAERREDTASTARGEIGEMERFRQSLLNRAVSMRHAYERELQASGIARILAPERLKRDETLFQSKMIVHAAKETVVKYRTQLMT